MKSTYRILILFLFITQTGFGQQKLIMLPNTINHPAINVSHPYISGDGSTLIYLSDYSERGGLTMYWSKKNGALWSQGVEMPRLVNRPDLNLQGAYTLNYDGSMVIVSSRKEGVGGYDLFYSTRSGDNWSSTANFGSPINSRANEGAGVFTMDGKGLYFMRCNQMNELKADDCQLYYAEKGYDKWNEPQLLPENINKYKPQMPRISADGNTLLFSSNVPGGKGGFDIYMTTKEGNSWTDPQNLEFINTPSNDQFISYGPRGRYFYTAQPGDKTSELVQVLIPEKLRPRSIYRIEGKIIDEEGKPVDAYVQVYDITNKARIKREKVSRDGSFSFTLTEGASYDVSLMPIDNKLSYFGKVYDLQEVPSRDKEVINYTATPIKLDVPYENENIEFEQFSAEVSKKSSFAVRRLADLLRNNPQWGIKLKSILYNYKEDTIVSGPDLTEIRVDTVFRRVEKIVPAQHIQTTITDTLMISELETNGTHFYDSLDTLMVMVERDSIYLQGSNERIALPAKKLKVNIFYHNDRTLKEVESLKNELISEGVEAEKIVVENEVLQIDDSTQKDKALEITILTMD